MISKNRYKKLIILFTFLNLLLISLISYSIYINTLKKRNFNNLIKQIDLNISRNAFDTAEISLRNIFTYAETKTDFKKLIKRAYQISRGTDNFDLLISISEKSFNKHKNDADIFNIYIFSLIQKKNYSNAFSLINKYKKIFLDESLSNVVYSAVFKLDKNPGILEIINNPDIVYILNGTRKSELYDRLYQNKQTPFLMTNYVLSLAAEGNYTKASNILNNSKNTYETDMEMQALIAYDNKEYLKAGLFLENIYKLKYRDFNDTGLLMLLCDTFMYNGEFKKAAEVYNIIIDTDPEFSWITYVNSDWLNIQSGYISSFSEDNVKYFPEEKEFLFLIQLKKNLVNNIPIDDIKNKPQSDFNKNQDKYIFDFWNYSNNDKMSEEFKVFFAKELYRMKRFDDLEIFLSREDNINQNWALFFNAALSFSKLNYRKASDYFVKYYNSTGDWAALYNSGLLNFIQNDYSSAIFMFSKIIDETFKSSEKELSDVYLLLSISYLMTEQFRDGVFYLDKAVKAGNRSLTASYLQNYYQGKIVEEHLD